jgi:hypothetical protein
MTSNDKSAVPLVGLLPSVMGALGYWGRAMVLTPFWPMLSKSEA